MEFSLEPGVGLCSPAYRLSIASLALEISGLWSDQEGNIEPKCLPRWGNRLSLDYIHMCVPPWQASPNLLAKGHDFTMIANRRLN